MQYSPSWKIIFDACRALFDLAYKPAEIDVGSVDWADLQKVAFEQRVLPLVADHCLTNTPEHPLRETGMYRVLFDLRTLNKLRNDVKIAHMDRLRCSLSERGVPSIRRKGVLYEGLLYGGRGLRQFNDIDIFVSPRDLDIVEAVLSELGTWTGHVNPNSFKPSRMSRAALISHRVHPDHLPSQVWETGDVTIPTIKLDICFDLSWYSCPFRAEAAEILETRLRDSKQLAASETDIGFHFVDCALHIYREGNLEQLIFRQNLGIRVSKFLDLAIMATRMDACNRETIATVLSAHNEMRRAVAWSSFFTDELFGTSLVNDLGLDEVADEELTRTWTKSGGEKGEWSGTIKDRLMAPETVSFS